MAKDKKKKREEFFDLNPVIRESKGQTRVSTESEEVLGPPTPINESETPELFKRASRPLKQRIGASEEASEGDFRNILAQSGTLKKNNLDKAQKSSEKFVKEVSKSEGLNLDNESVQLAAVSLIPVLLGGLFAGTDGLVQGAVAAGEGAKTFTTLKQKEEELSIKKGAIQAKKEAVSSKAKAKEAEQQLAKEKDLRSRIVPRVGTARTKKDAEILKEKKIKNEQLTSGISRIKELSKTDFASLSPVQRAEVNTEVSSMIGALRIPLVGPGPLTDTEREFIKDIIGNPTQIFSFSEVEFKKLEALENKLNLDFNEEIKIRTEEGLDPEREELMRLRAKFSK